MEIARCASGVSFESQCLPSQELEILENSRSRNAALPGSTSDTQMSLEVEHLNGCYAAASSVGRNLVGVTVSYRPLAAGQGRLPIFLGEWQLCRNVYACKVPVTMFLNSTNRNENIDPLMQ
jgi:hypothetical protein